MTKTLNNFKKILTCILVITCLFILTACQSLFNIGVGYKKQEILVGDEIQFEINVDDIAGEVTWSSSDEKVAIVDETGLVKGIGVGYTYITATNGDDSSSIYLIVKENTSLKPEEKEYIELSGNQTLVLKSLTKQSVQLVAKTYPIEDNEIIWESSDSEIATVDNNGLVTGVKPGVVTIKASLKNDSTVSKTIPMIVRTADGVQDIITNYIYNDTYVIDGTLDLSSINDKVTSVVAAKADSIIGISNYQYTTSSSVFGRTPTKTLDLASVGSAVIYKKEATINSGVYKYTVLTNNHVVEKNDELKAYLGDLDKEVPATLVRTDEDLDLAIVTFESDRDYAVIEFNEEETYKVGDFVLAIGNPTGYDYYGSVTFGIISYKDREMSSEKAVFIQHDAAINPGNSGGALLDLDGKLIGINTLKIATVDVEGMGFAVSMKSIKEFLNQN